VATSAAPPFDVKVYFSHDGVAFQAWHVQRIDSLTAGAFTIVFPTPVWCEFVRFRKLATDGSESLLAASAVTVFEEEWLDLSGYVTDGVTVEYSLDKEIGQYQLQHASVPLDNTQRLFSRRNTVSPFFDSAHGVHYCRANAKFLLQVMYRGADGRRPETGDGRPDWIALVTFFAKTFRNNPEAKVLTVAGKSGAVLLKTKTTQPVHELITPLRLLQDWLVRHDDDGRLLIPVNPGARVKTESSFEEFVGTARTFATNWRSVINLQDSLLVAVPHPTVYPILTSIDEAWLTANLNNGDRRRFGACTDNEFIYSLLYLKDGATRPYIEKIAFDGTVVQSTNIYNLGLGVSWIQDLCVSGEYLYFSDSAAGQGATIYKVKKDFSEAAVGVYEWTNPNGRRAAFYGLAFCPPDSPYPGKLIWVGRVLATTSPSWSYHEVMLIVDPDLSTATIYSGDGGSYPLEYLDSYGDFLIGHWTNSDAGVMDLRSIPFPWHDGFESFTILLPDKGGPIFASRNGIYLIRHNIGAGRVVELGFYLENGNIQYIGAAGFDDTRIFPKPLIILDGQLLPPTGTVVSGILVTDLYRLNLFTGELQMREFLRDGLRIQASYDYKYSLAYVRIEEQNRLSAINEVAFANDFVVYCNETNELQFRDRRYEEILICSDGETAVVDVRLGETYEAGGLAFIVHPSNATFSFNSLIVKSADRLVQFTEGVDFTIAYTAGRYYISFLDTSTVHSARVVRVRYLHQKEIPLLRDAVHIVQGGVDEEWGDENIINDVTVEGEKLLPNDTAISVQQVFAVSPNELKQTSRFANVQEVRPEGQFDWQPAQRTVDDDSKPDAQRRYFLEFEQPFVLGNSGFDIIYGDARDGSASGGDGQYGILKSGDETHNQSVTEAHFYRQELDLTAKDPVYFIMLDNNREWRPATAADFSDMAGNTTGTEPTDPADVKTTAHFFLKQMNGNYGKKNCHWMAYYTQKIRYYLDGDGRVIEDPSFTADDRAKNPRLTVSPEKRIAIVLTPENERQCPLFQLHGESGKEGYFVDGEPADDFDFFTGVLQLFSLQINRVMADMLGVNFDYESWSDVTQFVRVETTGYPLSIIEKVVGRAPATPEDVELYGLRERVLTSNFIQNISAARNRAYGVKELRGSERSGFSVEVLFDAGLSLEMLVRVIETFDAVDSLFEVVKLVHRLNVKAPSTSRLQLEEVDLS